MSKRKSRPELVKELKNLWGNYHPQHQYLKSVVIGPKKALRGVQDSKMELKFPVTVLCGPNGTGKTTFLALSVLAFHDANSMTLSISPKGYYDFGYFFGFSEREKHEAGIVISWEYTNGTSDTLEKGKERWMRYIKNNGTPRRPERSTEFVGLSRIVPPFEKRGYKKEFKNLKDHKGKSEQKELSLYMGQIMGRPYKSVTSYKVKNSVGAHQLNAYNSTHTSFNAGAGEECLTYILDTLLSTKDGAIVAIEEIEIGLHPATMERLVDVILEIAAKKKLQILITTHSPYFLRACPKESVVLAERSEAKVVFTHMPNIENAVQSIAGKANADLFIVCEDEIAAEFIRLGMNKKQRDIVHIKAYGSKNELIKKAEVIHETSKKNVLVVWDADVEDNLLQDVTALSGISGAKLPGTLPPEKFIIEAINSDAIKSEIMNDYGLSDGEWNQLKGAVSVLADHHDLPYTLKQHLSSDDEGTAPLTKAVCRYVFNAKKEDFEPLLKSICDILDPEKAAA